MLISQPHMAYSPILLRHIEGSFSMSMNYYDLNTTIYLKKVNNKSGASSRSRIYIVSVCRTDAIPLGDRSIKWCHQLGLNERPIPYERTVLPSELWWQKVVDCPRIELGSDALQASAEITKLAHSPKIIVLSKFLLVPQNTVQLLQ